MDEQGGASAKDKETVKVVVRCRPLFGKEIVEGRKPIVTIDPQASIISIKCPENDQIKSFTFDSVYDESTSQRQFYDESGYPLVESIFDGYNGTIFAYGQTGCGKTHTMQGKDNPPELRGVIPHSFDHIFESISADPSREYMVRASYLEIYNEDIRDLLGDDSKKKLDLKESADGSVYVKDLTEVVVSDVDSINRVMNRGFKNRTVGATLMNEGSSRSHSIFTVVVETSQKIEGQEHFKAGKLNLVDLAGSERQSKTGATGNRLKEGCKINLSLSALGNVISALVDGKGKHIPYRDSKLTRLLQDSLGGNTKTLMVAAVSPADYNYDETLSTLRYANRAKNIKNKPIVNEDPKDAKLREYKEEIERLTKMLESQSRGSVMGSASGMSTPRSTETPLSRSTLSSPENATRELMAATPVAAVNSDLVDQALAKEREEIAKYQKEAAEMLQRAKQMMDEARALQEEQQRAQALQQQQQQELEKEMEASISQPAAAVGIIDTSTPTVTSPSENDEVSEPVQPSAINTPSAAATAAGIISIPKPTAPVEPLSLTPSSTALGGLPPLKTPRARQLSRPDVLADLAQEKRDVAAAAPSLQAEEASVPVQSTTTSQTGVNPVLSRVPSSTAASAAAAAIVSPPARSKADDEAIAKALREAAQVDAQAKEMMLRAEQMMEEAEARAKEAQKVKIVKEVVVKEVIPDHHVKEKEELKEFNQTILNQRDKMGKELEKTQQVVESFMKEKEELHNKLRKIESQILGGTSNRKLDDGSGGSSATTGPLVDSEVALLKQQVDYRRAQIKLKEKVKKEAQNEAARKALAIEKQQIEEELKSAQEAAQANLAAAKKKETKYRAKLDAARQEIVDLNNEFERERENLLDTIREQTKETKLLEQLVEIFLPQNELVRVWKRAVWVEEREEWNLPKLKPRSDFQKIKLPTLHFSGGGGGGGSGSSANSAVSATGEGGGGGIESGGAEVISDDEGAITSSGGGIQSANGGSTVRSSSSSASSKRRKSVKDAYHSSMPPSKPSSSSDTSMSTGRIEENGYSASPFLPSYGVRSTSSSSSSHHHHPPPMHSSRLLSPENGRLPSAVRSSRYDPQKDESILECSSSHKSKKPSSSSSNGGGSGSGSRERKRSKERREKDHHGLNGVPPLLPTNNEARSPTDMHINGGGGSDKFFPSENDLLASLTSEYQPRDRLQSRKGSRQGSRDNGDTTGLNSATGSSSSQSSLSEFEYPPPAEKSSSRRDPSSRSGAAGTSSGRHGHSSSTSGGGSDSGFRRHRERQEDGCNDDLKDVGAMVGVSDVPVDGSGSKKKSSSLSSSSSGKHKKKKEKKEKHSHGNSGGGDNYAPYDDFDIPDLQYGITAARGSVQSPEDQDSEY